MELLENLLWSIASKRLCYSIGILRLFYVMGGLLVCNYCICLSQKLECRRQESRRGVENVCHVCPTEFTLWLCDDWIFPSSWYVRIPVI